MSVTQRDVMLALLALDAYNRHADQEERKISEGQDQISSQIGHVTWIRSSDQVEDAPGETLSGSKFAGFSASEYSWNGQKVISYRGTDFDFSTWEGVADFMRDFGAGWAQSFGVLSPDELEVIPGQSLFTVTLHLSYCDHLQTPALPCR